MTLTSLFSTVLDLTAAGSIAIVCVLLARLVLNRAPKWISYALWAVVLFRLLCPVTIESPVSLMPDRTMPTARTETQQSTAQPEPVTPVLPVTSDTAPGSETVQPQPGRAEIAPAARPDKMTVLAIIWLAGMGCVTVYAIVSLVLVRRRLIGAVPLEGNVWLADHIPSPFVLGLFRPKIYLPSTLEASELEYILLHERTHIARRDNLTRLLAWIALTVHWFNPLVWIAFVCSGHDMERSCDEAVLKKLGTDIRQDYSASLLRLSAGRHILAAAPLAFGESDTKGRIRHVLNYRRPRFWVVVVALIAAVALTVGLATDRAKKAEDTADVTFADMFWYLAEDRNDPEASEELFRSIGTVINESQTADGVTATLEGILCADGDVYLSVSFDIANGPEDSFTSVADMDSWIVPSDTTIQQMMMVSSYYDENGLDGWRERLKDWSDLTMRYWNRPGTEDYRLFIRAKSVHPGENILHLEQLELGSVTIAGPFEFTFTVTDSAPAQEYALSTTAVLSDSLSVLVQFVRVTPFSVTVTAVTQDIVGDEENGNPLQVYKNGALYPIRGSMRQTERYEDAPTQLIWSVGPGDRIFDPSHITAISLGDTLIPLGADELCGYPTAEDFDTGSLNAALKEELGGSPVVFSVIEPEHTPGYAIVGYTDASAFGKQAIGYAVVARGEDACRITDAHTLRKENAKISETSMNTIVCGEKDAPWTVNNTFQAILSNDPALASVRVEVDGQELWTCQVDAVPFLEVIPLSETLGEFHLWFLDRDGRILNERSTGFSEVAYGKTVDALDG